MSIPARSHFLIQGASGGEYGDQLFTPDVESTVNLLLMVVK